MLVWFCSTLMLTLGWSHEIDSNTIGYSKNYGNSSHNVCLIDDNQIKFRSIKLETPETKGIEPQKLAFHETTQRSNANLIYHFDDPNTKQVLLSKGLIENSNYVFDKMYNIDPSFFIEKSSALVKYPRFKPDLIKGIHGPSRIRRADQGFEQASFDYTDSSREDFENEGSLKHSKRKKYKLREDSEMRVHCIRSGPNQVVCEHDNFSFSFKLPHELFKKEIMEKLVSSVCSIVEDAIPEEVSNTGPLVDIAISRVQPKIKEDRNNAYIFKKDYRDRGTPKVIKINIPIDFGALPLNNEDIDERNIDKLETPVEDSFLDNDDNCLLQTEKPKFKQFKIDNSYINLLQQNKDNGAMKRADNYNHFKDRPNFTKK